MGSVAAQAQDNPVGQLDAYDRQNLVAHLAECQRHGELLRLLELETPEGRNAWFEARDASGGEEGYVADIRASWRCVGEATTSMDSVGARCRFALILASLASLAGNLPPPFLEALVKQRVWSSRRAQAYTLQIAEAEIRAQAQVSLLSYVPESERLLCVRQTLASVHVLSTQKTKGPLIRDWDRANLLADLVTRYPGRLPLEVVSAIVDELPGLESGPRWKVLESLRVVEASVIDLGALAKRFAAPALVTMALAKRLPQQTQEILSRQLLRDAETADAQTRLATYIALAPYSNQLGPDLQKLGQDLLGTTMKNLASADVAAYIDGRFTAIDLFPFVPEQQRRALLEAFLKSVSRESQWLVKIVSAIPPSLRGRIVSEAREIADRVPRTNALADLAPYLEEPERTVVVSEVMEAVLSSQEDSALWLADTLERVAQFLPRHLFLRALTVARAARRTRWRGQALAFLALAASAEERDGMLAETLAETLTLPDQVDRRSVLVKIAKDLTVPLLRKALNDLRTIGDGPSLTSNLPSLFPWLSSPDQARAWRLGLDLTAGMEHEGDRSNFMVGVASYLIVDLKPEALREARALQQPIPRAKALVALAIGLTNHMRTLVLDELEAVLDAEAQMYARDRADLAVSVLSIAPDERRGKAFDRALRAIRGLETLYEQAPFLSRLGPFLSDEKRDEIMRRALQAPQPNGKARGVLSVLAPHLSEEVVKRLLVDLANPLHLGRRRWADLYESVANSRFQLGFRIEDENGAPFVALCRRLAALGDPLLAYELMLTRREPMQAWGLASVAPALPQELGREAVSRSLELLGGSVTAELWATDVWGPTGGGSTFDPTAQEYVLALLSAEIARLGDEHTALKKAREIGEADYKSAALTAIAPYLRDSVRIQALMEALVAARDIIGPEDRRTRLTEAAAVLGKETVPLPGTAVDELLFWISSRSRHDAVPELCCLIPILVRQGGPMTPTEILDGIKDVTRWWP